MENKNYLLFPFLAMGLLLGNSAYGVYLVTTDTTEIGFDASAQRSVKQVSRVVDVHFGNQKPVNIYAGTDDEHKVINRSVERIERNDLKSKLWFETFKRLSSINFWDLKSSEDLDALGETLQEIEDRLNSRILIRSYPHQDANLLVRNKARELIEQTTRRIDVAFFKRL